MTSYGRAAESRSRPIQLKSLEQYFEGGHYGKKKASLYIIKTQCYDNGEPIITLRLFRVRRQFDQIEGFSVLRSHKLTIA